MANQQIKVREQAAEHVHKPHKSDSCGYFPELTRLKYFYGQMLGVHDFQTEQNYFREKLKLHNRCLHGYGSVCGLEVVPEPFEPECESPADDEKVSLEAHLKELEALLEQTKDPKEQDEIRQKMEEIKRRLEELPNDANLEKGPTIVNIECGLALDCEGNELLVRYPIRVDLWKELCPEDRKRVTQEGQSIYLSICYCPLPVEPVRPVLMDACGSTSECVPSKLRDSVRVIVTLDPPGQDDRCETCCTCCADPCLLLAEIKDFIPNVPIKDGQVMNGVRRMISLYPSTTITGVSWTHGAEYSADVIGDFLEKGIEIRFSRPVLTETITNGVVDLWVVEGGRGRHADIYNMDGTLDLPDTRTTTSLKFQQTSGERLQEGDRVLVAVRTSFILDECCRPVDGENIGGRVPTLPEYEEFERESGNKACVDPPLKFGPWSSGNGVPAGTFESWFYVNSDEEKYEKKEKKKKKSTGKKRKVSKREL